MKKKFIAIILMGGLIAVSGCATKTFEKLPALPPEVANQMTCEQIEKEFFDLYNYEGHVDEEASTGQAKQIFWGGLWSVMADEKLESVARKDIRNRTRLLYDLKIKKGCK